MIDLQEFLELSRPYGLACDTLEKIYPSLSLYCAELLDWNTRINLTAITDERDVAVKHFIDSILPLSFFEMPTGASLIDVGTGAGFPSLPMKLYRPDIALTLLDSLEKRLVFLRALCKKLKIDSETVHMRAEDAGRDIHYREKYDIATARAVSNMNVLCEYCLPLVKPNGFFIAMKGSSGASEAASAEKAISLCGGKLTDIIEYSLPGGDKRSLIVVKKVSPSPKSYPRTSAKIKSSPL